MPLRVTVWNEFVHERKNPAVAELYPEGIHETIATALNRSGDIVARCAWLDQPEHGLTDEVLDQTDVLTWWGHTAHRLVDDRIVEKVYGRVMAGMGMVVLHSGHHSKIFKKLMGTTCNLKWRIADDREILWITKPNHPILAGIDDHFVLASEEMYGECFDVPEPMETILISHFSGGEVFRSGLTYTRGAGKIFYFRPGHESYPTYHDANVQRIIRNACHWAAPVPGGTVPIGCPNPKMGWV